VVAVHEERKKLNHRLSHRLWGVLHLSYRLPRRPLVGSQRLGEETFIRRAESTTALPRRLIPNALVRRSRVPPHRRGGPRRLSAIVLGSKTAKGFACSMYRSSSAPPEAAHGAAPSSRPLPLAPQLPLRTLPPLPP